MYSAWDNYQNWTYVNVHHIYLSWLNTKYINIDSIIPSMHKKDVTSHVRSSYIHPIYHIEALHDTFYCVDFPRSSQP